MKKNILLEIGILSCVLSACVPIGSTDGPVVTPFPSVSPRVSTEPPSTISDTPAQTEIPTPTIFPVLSIHDAESALLALLQRNGDCRLPCFIGFSPGETRASEAMSQLNMFHNLADFSGYGEFGGDMGFIIQREGIDYITHLVFDWYRHGSQADLLRYIKVAFSAFETQGDANQFSYVYGDPNYNQFFQNYTLSAILLTYGPPENVYAFYESEMGAHEFYLLVDYTSAGWRIDFKMPLYMRDRIAVGCPSEAFASFSLWLPDDQVAAREFGFLNYQGPLKPIEEITSMTREEFFLTFGDPFNTRCIELPVVTNAP